VQKTWDEYKKKCNATNEVYNITVKIPQQPNQETVMTNIVSTNDVEDVIAQVEINTLQTTIDPGTSTGCESEPQVLQDLTALIQVQRQ
jgi:hypothetical protein